MQGRTLGTLIIFSEMLGKTLSSLESHGRANTVVQDPKALAGLLRRLSSQACWSAD